MSLAVGTENHVVARGGSDVKRQAKKNVDVAQSGRRIHPRGRGMSAASRIAVTCDRHFALDIWNRVNIAQMQRSGEDTKLRESQTAAFIGSYFRLKHKFRETGSEHVLALQLEALQLGILTVNDISRNTECDQ